MRLRKHRNTSTGVLREKNYFHRDTVQDSEQPKLLSSDAAKPDRATFLAHIEYGDHVVVSNDIFALLVLRVISEGVITGGESCGA